MKNKKPLQFVKELPPHTELWKIIDETIIHPAKGLSVEQLKHYMYSYLHVCSDFKTAKLMLQTDMATEHVLTIKGHTQKHRGMLYPELLPEIPGLPRTLLAFLYEHMVRMNVIPIEYHESYMKVIRILVNPLPNLSTLPHSDEIVEVYEKRQVKLVIYKALIESMRIPTFKLVVETASDDSDGWVEWNGGVCPVDGDTYLEIKLRKGDTIKGSHFQWEHLSMESDIVAYRILEKTG